MATPSLSAKATAPTFLPLQSALNLLAPSLVWPSSSSSPAADLAPIHALVVQFKLIQLSRLKVDLQAMLLRDSDVDLWGHLLFLCSHQLNQVNHGQAECEAIAARLAAMTFDDILRFEAAILDDLACATAVDAVAHHQLTLEFIQAYKIKAQLHFPLATDVKPATATKIIALPPPATWRGFPVVATESTCSV
ncbi:Aste57867_18280 [Aphanomyces stellatus]|uniref:Aste57867_18280 protein n=1 Tax=Aphanomyces stellatus TaxID=120398 RepID=A0A485LAA4_9STRA|nr:hypothetical protein As57867_018218 [Aphanomyces stellatus]VFT95017.1 Aste57867_18280 [Aphanomyces stellatus]